MLTKYLNRAQKDETKRWVETVLAAQFRKKDFRENQVQIEHILDFLDSVEAPKRFLKMSYLTAYEQSRLWVKRLAARGSNLEDKKEDIRTIKKIGQFKIVELLTENALKREGNLMAHCVASYVNKISDKHKIYSLRDKDNKPHVTFEISLEKSGNVSQIKGKGNGSIHPKYITAVLKFLKSLKSFDVNENDMRHLGYFYLEPTLLEVAKSLDDTLKVVEINKKRFIFRGC